MDLDVRLPMGTMFSILGILLVVVGAMSKEADLTKSLGINVDFWWGLVMAALGAVMLLLVWRARGRALGKAAGT